MKLIRYEFNGEGLFNALDYLYSADMTKDDEIEFNKADDYFEYNLKPIKNVDLSKWYKCYFTEVGFNKFRPYITIMNNLFEKYVDELGIGELIKLEVPDDISVIYKDEYQVAIANEDIESLNKKG